MGEVVHLSHLGPEDVHLDYLEPEMVHLANQSSKGLHQMVQRILLPDQAQMQVNKYVRHPQLQVNLGSTWSPLLINSWWMKPMKLTKRR